MSLRRNRYLPYGRQFLRSKSQRKTFPLVMSLRMPPQMHGIKSSTDHRQGPSNSTETSSMRRRLFAGMKSLTGFGSRSRHGSPGHRSISLPERVTGAY
ncbi:hypothetical protein NQ317_014139 [Molorchus minor]|uniref:Uncharacterized protein n=1 Tax=Molorchus minor TaxID=1323400 RepID=A0ABQ9JFV2_9CUCU|nr:hypothetical protein NQ317_014139 [Molorchus minor]